MQALCIWCRSWDSCNKHNTKFSQSYLQVSSSGPCNVLLWAGFLGSTGRSLDLLVPVEISPAPWAEPRRAEGAMNPKKWLEGSAAKGQPAKVTEGARKLCWEVHETGLKAVEGLTAHSMVPKGEKKPQSFFLIHNSLNQYFRTDREMTKKETKTGKKKWHKFRAIFWLRVMFQLGKWTVFNNITLKKHLQWEFQLYHSKVSERTSFYKMLF